MHTMQFLQKILPQSGVKQWWAKRGNEIRHGACSTVEDLEKVLLEVDRRGADVYFACAAYKDGLTREQNNVAAVRAFWLDLDADNPNARKDYRTKEDAYQALYEFCQKAGLPFPTVVCSGYGIHAYWTLKADITREEWKKKALLLKKLTEAHGLKVDPPRTSDEASILRAPGTRNHKIPDAPQPVYVMHEAEALDDFTPNLSVINGNSGLTGGIKDKAERPDMAQGYGDGGRTDALTKRIGWLIGPDGLGYDDALTQIRAWNAYNMPPLPDEKLVSTFNSLWEKESRNKETKTVEVFSAPSPPPLPYGFKWGRDMQLLSVKESADGESEEVEVSEFPVYLDRIVSHEKSKATSLLFKHRLPLEGWRDVVIPAKEMRGQAWAGMMAEQNANINWWAEKQFMTYVTRARNMLNKSIKSETQYSQCGPRENFTQFVVGNRLIKADGTVSDCIVTPDLQVRAKHLGPQKGATLAGWSHYANCLFANGCEAQSLTVLSSFGAVLMHKLCPTEGGAVLSLLSIKSSHGKTTAIEAAASVWGHLDGLKVATADTFNSVTKAWGTLGYLPIVWDEKDNKPRDSGFIVKQKQIFTNGSDRARLNRDGTAQEDPNHWHTITIEGTNRPFAEIAAEAKEEAMLARVLEVEVTLPAHIRDNPVNNDVRIGLGRNAGVAGEAFLKYIMQPEVMRWIDSQMEPVSEQIQRKYGLGGEYRYISWMMACNTVAGYILNQMGLLTFDLDRIISYGCKAAVARREDKEETNPEAQAAQALIDLIANNIADAVIVDTPCTGGIPVTVKREPGSKGLHMRVETETRKCYISCNAFRKYCRLADVQSYRWMARELMASGVISPSKTRRALGSGTKFETASQWCYEVNLDHPIMGESGIEQQITAS